MRNATFSLLATFLIRVAATIDSQDETLHHAHTKVSQLKNNNRSVSTSALDATVDCKLFMVWCRSESSSDKDSFTCRQYYAIDFKETGCAALDTTGTEDEGYTFKLERNTICRYYEGIACTGEATDRRGPSSPASIRGYGSVQCWLDSASCPHR